MKAYVNGSFISCEEKNREFSVMVENKGRIVYTGDSLPEKYKKAEKIQMNGKAVLPAFADTHMHFESFALFNSTVDVRDAKDFEEMGQMLRGYLAKNPKAKFIPAYGCSAHTVKEKRLPNKDDLDKMVSIPTMIVKYDGHAAVANSALIADFPDSVKNDPGFVGDGWLYQNAFYEGVNCITAKVSVLKLLSGMASAADALASKGLGLIHSVEGVGYKNDIDVDTIQLIRHGFPQCFRVYFQTMDVKKALKKKTKGIGGCFSLALDGCFGSEDAALSQPYSNNTENKGFLAYTQEQVNDFCIKANRAGLQITMHAIGDVAVEQAIIAYETALKDFPQKDHHHIIIHADLIPEELQKRAAALGLCVAVQPVFLRWKQEPDEYLQSILGERAKHMLPLRSMLKKGILLSAGSDAPCTLPNPMESIYNCVCHPNPDESIGILDALRMHTLWAAKTSFDEKDRGSLTDGKICDFVVLDKNPLEIAPEELLNVKVTDVYLAGKKYVSENVGAAKLILRSIGAKLGKKQFN